MHFVAGSLDGNSLTVKFIQDIDMSRVLTLYTNQSFNDSIKFSNVQLQGSIDVKGHVNGMDLLKEFNNTLMVRESKLKKF